ncbi:hypothetical protein IGI37_002756 [Enterococcus sp. AZ194]|uniref:helix-turn-helix domain-containing protein n=1 Tax=Enterococcus sp. AZ194 TaxID=2774629 RepID=UPI003F2512B0
MILNKREVGKLVFLKYLVTKDNPISKDWLLTELAVSASTLKRYVQSINEDLHNIKEFNQIKIIEEVGYSIDNPTPFNSQYVLRKMNYRYHINSLQFQLLERIFSTSIRSIHDLAASLAISLPYIYKLLLTANQFLKPFHIQIDYSFNADSLGISGSNANIRLFETYFFWNVTQGIEWLFKNISVDELFSCFTEREFKAIFDSSLAKQTKFLHSLAIIHQIYPVRKKKLHLEESVKQILAVFQDINDLSGPLNRLLQTHYPMIQDSEALLSERLFFNFMSRIFNSYKDPHEIQLQIGQRLLQLDNELIDFCKQLINALTLENPEMKDMSNYHELKCELSYFFSIYIINIRSIGFDSSHLQDFMFINPTMQTVKSKLYQKGERFFNQFLEKTAFINKDEISSFHLTLGHSLVYYFLSQMKQRPLKIYVQFSKNMFGAVYIHSQLYNFFGRENIEVIEDMTTADIIISDFYEKRYKSDNYFYFDDPTNQESWSRLFTFVHRYQISHTL